MNPDRRWMVLRTLLWIGIVVYAVIIIRDHKRSDSVGAAMAEVAGFAAPPIVWIEVARPAAGSPPNAAAGDITDALGTFQAVFDDSCPMNGRTFRLSLGTAGLDRVEADGPVPPCVADRIWAASWPAVVPNIELEVGG